MLRAGGGRVSYYHQGTDMLDRAVQRQILELLRDHYPRGTFPVRKLELDMAQAATNLLYLEEHGLCKSGVKIGGRGDFAFSESTITAGGLDFLEDDGGLSAILGVVTVKLHADTIRDMIAAKIESSSMPAEEKSKLRKVLSNLSEAALKAATTDLVKSGLDHLPTLRIGCAPLDCRRDLSRGARVPKIVQDRGRAAPVDGGLELVGEHSFSVRDQVPPKGARDFRQSSAVAENGSCNDSVFRRGSRCSDTDLPGFAGTPARLSKAGFVFLGFVSPN
jgi:hypothetical protein